MDIGPNEFNPKHGKFRVNLFVDLDVVDEIRRIAAKRHLPYQTLINQKLRELFMNETSLEERVEKIEKALSKRRA